MLQSMYAWQFYLYTFYTLAHKPNVCDEQKGNNMSMLGYELST